MTILDTKDWNLIQNAMRCKESIQMEVTYQPFDARVMITTSEVDEPWTVPMVVTVKVHTRGAIWHQHCESVEQAKKVLEEWNGWQ